MLTKCSHLVGYMMTLMIEQMRNEKCRRMLGQQMLVQFIKCTKFGPMVRQLELLLQQFHNTFFNSIGGITIRGTPKISIDVGDVQYQLGGLFQKTMRKSAEEERYFAARSRARDEDCEAAGTSHEELIRRLKNLIHDSSKALCAHHTEIEEFENIFSISGERFKQALGKIAKECMKIRASGMETPINEDRRYEREVPARKVRRKLISYKDLDRPKNDGPDLRNVTITL